MKFKKYETKKEFLDENLEILLKEEIANETMIGILLPKEDHQLTEWFLGRIEDGDEVKAIFLVEDDRIALNVYSLEDEISDEVVDCIIENLVALDVDLLEVSAEKQDSIKLAEKYLSMKLEKKINRIEGSNIYAYTGEEHPEFELLPGERFEKIENNEENLPFEMDIIRLIYSDTYKIADPCPDAYAERVAKAFLRKGAYLLKNEKNEAPLHIVTVRKQINGCAIGALITTREHRGTGYGKRGIYSFCKKLMDEGNKFVTLHVNPANASAAVLYEKVGFKLVQENLDYKLEN